MKLYKRYYLITVTDKSGKIVREAEEFNGNDASEEVMMLGKEYPNCEIATVLKMEEV